jgi:hypothetical protein
MSGASQLPAPPAEVVAVLLADGVLGCHFEEIGNSYG